VLAKIFCIPRFRRFACSVLRDLENSYSIPDCLEHNLVNDNYVVMITPLSDFIDLICMVLYHLDATAPPNPF
jgi:hypothetical protein